MTYSNILEVSADSGAKSAPTTKLGYINPNQFYCLAGFSEELIQSICRRMDVDEFASREDVLTGAQAIADLLGISVEVKLIDDEDGFEHDAGVRFVEPITKGGC